jgi:hypothetical protein
MPGGIANDRLHPIRKFGVCTSPVSNTPGGKSMSVSREFRARILAAANLAEGIFDLAPHVEVADLVAPLERLAARIGALLNEAVEAAQGRKKTSS